jgi:hypothetical protein
MSEFNFYQIDHTGVADTEHTIASVSGTVQSYPIRRKSDEKLSNFGALNVGNRMDSDYTRTSLGFKDKDELADYETLTEDTGMGQNIAGRAINVEHNPYVAGSTVKRVRDEQAFRMGMSDNRGSSVGAPSFDVSDTNLVDASGMVSGKNWPSEGWRSFGGKYDFEYTGGGIH